MPSCSLGSQFQPVYARALRPGRSSSARYSARMPLACAVSAPDMTPTGSAPGPSWWAPSGRVVHRRAACSPSDPRLPLRSVEQREPHAARRRPAWPAFWRRCAASARRAAFTRVRPSSRDLTPRERNPLMPRPWARQCRVARRARTVGEDVRNHTRRTRPYLSPASLPGDRGGARRRARDRDFCPGPARGGRESRDIRLNTLALGA